MGERSQGQKKSRREKNAGKVKRQWETKPENNQPKSAGGKHTEPAGWAPKKRVSGASSRARLRDDHHSRENETQAGAKANDYLTKMEEMDKVLERLERRIDRIGRVAQWGAASDDRSTASESATEERLDAEESSGDVILLVLQKIVGV